MTYGITLLDLAKDKVGSYYKLAQLMGVQEQSISAIRHGRRKVPLKWVPMLCEVAEVRIDFAMQELARERASNDVQRERLGKRVAVGVAAMLLFFINAGSNSDVIAAMVKHPESTFVHIVLSNVRTWLRGLWRPSAAAC